MQEISNIGRQAKAKRQDMGLTQNDIANKAGVSRRWLINFENGKTDGLNMEKVVSVLNKLGLNLSLEEKKPRSERSNYILNRWAR